MKIESGFEMVNIADDYMLIPVGDKIEKFNGTVILNEVSAFLFVHMKTDVTKEELVSSLTEKYKVDYETAQKDVDKALDEMMRIGVIHE